MLIDMCDCHKKYLVFFCLQVCVMRVESCDPKVPY